MSDSKNNQKKAQLRWKILAQALVGPERLKVTEPQSCPVSVRKFKNFGLVRVDEITDRLEEEDSCTWKRFSMSGVTLDLCLFEHVGSLDELTGFNNTGNICIWPSEEILAHFIVENRSRIGWLAEVRRVVELGGGMTCLAGLVCSALTRGPFDNVLLTDGNKKSCANVKKNVMRNNSLFTSSQVDVQQLVWGESLPKSLHHFFEMVVCADCFFFTESHRDLLNTIDTLLTPTGHCLAFAPARQGTLDRFKSLVLEDGRFDVNVQHNYSDTVSHLDERLRVENSCYDPDLHYPIMVLLTRAG